MDYFFRKLRTEYPPVADDLFERADIAESLTRIIGQSEQPTSILVDGDWGSGKSVFLKRLKAGFEERNWPCVVVDAFRLDYHSDAFTAVAGEVVKVARAKAGETPAFMALVSKGKSVAKVLVKAGIRVGSAGLIDEAGLSELGSEIVKQGSADLEEFASELIEGREKE